MKSKIPQAPANEHLPDELRKAVLESVASQAAALAKLVMTVSSAFLGGSLLFLEKVVDNLNSLGFWFLALGWSLLIGSITLVAWDGVLNTSSAFHALEGSWEKARNRDKKGRGCVFCATLCLAGGMAFIMCFGLTGLLSKRGVNMDEQRTNIVTGKTGPGGGRYIKGSVPYGSLLVPGSTDAPAEPPPPDSAAASPGTSDEVAPAPPAPNGDK